MMNADDMLSLGRSLAQIYKGALEELGELGGQNKAIALQLTIGFFQAQLIGKVKKGDDPLQFLISDEDMQRMRGASEEESQSGESDAL